MHIYLYTDAMHALMDLKRLSHFVLLAEELNFTRAADRANLSQTAFSRSIQTLETMFGLALFDRGTRTVKLTYTGKQLVVKARALLAQSHDLMREVDDFATIQSGQLSFGASTMTIDSVVGLALPSLMQQRPHLQVNIEVSHWRLLQQHLEQERIEFFVSYPGLLRKNSRFVVTRLPPIPSSVFCRPQHPLLAEGQSPKATDLARYPWATIQLRDNADADMRRLFGVPADKPLPLALTCDSQSLLREAVLTSDKLLFTWSGWITQDIHARELVDLGALLRPTLPQRAWLIECAIIQLAGRTPSPAARRLIELIKLGVT